MTGWFVSSEMAEGEFREGEREAREKADTVCGCEVRNVCWLQVQKHLSVAFVTAAQTLFLTWAP